MSARRFVAVSERAASPHTSAATRTHFRIVQGFVS